MTRKHFNYAAKLIRESYSMTAHEKAIVAINFATMFMHFNPAFDRDRFYDAAGLNHKDASND